MPKGTVSKHSSFHFLFIIPISGRVVVIVIIVITTMLLEEVLVMGMDAMDLGGALNGSSGFSLVAARKRGHSL